MLHPKKQVDSKRTTATRINKHTNLPNTTRKIVYFDKHTCKIMQFQNYKIGKRDFGNFLQSVISQIYIGIKQMNKEIHNNIGRQLIISTHNS